MHSVGDSSFAQGETTTTGPPLKRNSAASADTGSCQSISGSDGTHLPDANMSAAVSNLVKHPQRRQSVPDAFQSNRETNGNEVQTANQLTRQKAYSFDDMATEPSRAQPPTPVGSPAPLIVQGRIVPNRAGVNAQVQQTVYPPPCTQDSTQVQIPALGAARVIGNARTSVCKTDSSFGIFYPSVLRKRIAP